MTLSTGTMAIRAAVGGCVRWTKRHGYGVCVVCGHTEGGGRLDVRSWAVNPRAELGPLASGLCDVCLDRVLVLLETPMRDWAATLASEIGRHAPINTLDLALHLARGAARKTAISEAISSRLTASIVKAVRRRRPQP